MAALKNAPDTAYDDLAMVLAGGSWSNIESAPAMPCVGTYTFVREPVWDYAGVMPSIQGALSGGIGAGPIIGCRWIRGTARCS